MVFCSYLQSTPMYVISITKSYGTGKAEERGAAHRYNETPVGFPLIDNVTFGYCAACADPLAHLSDHLILLRRDSPYLVSCLLGYLSLFRGRCFPYCLLIHCLICRLRTHFALLAGQSNMFSDFSKVMGSKSTARKPLRRRHGSQHSE